MGVIVAVALAGADESASVVRPDSDRVEPSVLETGTVDVITNKPTSERVETAKLREKIAGWAESWL